MGTEGTAVAVAPAGVSGAHSWPGFRGLLFGFCGAQVTSLNSPRLTSKRSLNQKTLHLRVGRGVSERFISASISRLGRALEKGSRRNKCKFRKLQSQTLSPRIPRVQAGARWESASGASDSDGGERPATLEACPAPVAATLATTGSGDGILRCLPPTHSGVPQRRGERRGATAFRSCRARARSLS